MTEIPSNKLITAMHAVQGSLTGVKRDSSNPHFKNRYASLESVIDTLRPHLQANGLIVTQAPGRMTEHGCLEVTTTISHISGQSMTTRFEIPLTKRDAQGAGSAITYASRYSLMSLFMLPPTDDDGEGAIDRPNRVVSEVPTAPTKSSNGIKKDNPDRWKQVERLIRDATTKDMLRDLKVGLIDEVKDWPVAWREALNDEYSKRYEELA